MGLISLFLFIYFLINLFLFFKSFSILINDNLHISYLYLFCGIILHDILVYIIFAIQSLYQLFT